jgi:O-methyltransferase
VFDFDDLPVRDAEIKKIVAEAYAAIRKQKPWSHKKTPNVIHHRVLPYATYCPWLSDEEFKSVYDKIQNYTLVDIYRCYELWTIAKQLADIDGCFLEVGVWRGGTGALIAEAIKNKCTKKIYLADTFAGVVKAGKNDPVYKGGEHSDTSKTLVESLLRELDLTNAVLLEGIFPEETSNLINEPIVFLHCDVDVYSSAKDIINWGIPRLCSGGAIIFDDYGFSGCEGITQFVNELRLNSGFIFIHNLNGHAIFIKK